MKEKLLHVSEILIENDIECWVIRMREGNVFTVDLTITPEKNNFVLEDDIIVRKEGAELLSHRRRRLLLYSIPILIFLSASPATPCTFFFSFSIPDSPRRA
jgi:hypothetical protein